MPIPLDATDWGVTSSQTLNQLQADAYGRGIFVYEDPEATAKGALLVALVSRGYFRNVDEAFRAVVSAEGKEYQTNPEFAKTYAAKRERMNRLYMCTQNL